MLGSAFCDHIRALRRLPDREEAVFAAAAAGCYVPFAFTRVRVGSRFLLVANDYFSIGTPEDLVRVPASAPLAARLCALLAYRLPTEEEVDAIYAAADVRLEFYGWGERPTHRPDGSVIAGNPYAELMLSVERFEEHSAIIDAQLDGRGGLVAGHKKDVLGELAGMLLFYGGFDRSGRRIQPNNPRAHEKTYADYSHGLRLVRDALGDP